MSLVGATVKRGVSSIPGARWFPRVVMETARIAIRYRVTGLAAEAGFFALLSLPPLILGLFGGLGYVGRWLGPQTVSDVRVAIEEWASQFLTPQIISETLAPTIDEVFNGGRLDLLSIGFVLALWSGSRAANVFVDTISIMYGQSGVRGIVPTRALSFSLYVILLALGVFIIPLVLVGPTVLGNLLPRGFEWVGGLYWPFVLIVTIVGLTTIYHVATPRRTPWTWDMPGTGLTLILWFLASYAVRAIISASLGGFSIYGPLAAPIILLIWLYALAIAVLIGAAFNAALRTVLEPREEAPVSRRLAARLQGNGRAADAQDATPPQDWSETGELAILRAAALAPLTPVDPEQKAPREPAESS